MTAPWSRYILLFLIAAAFFSCAIQKRRYRSGFYISNPSHTITHKATAADKPLSPAATNSSATIAAKPAAQPPEPSLLATAAASAITILNHPAAFKQIKLLYTAIAAQGSAKAKQLPGPGEVQKQDQVPARKLSGLSVAAFVACLFALFLLVMGLLLIAAVESGQTLAYFGALLIALSAIGILVSFFLGLAAVIQKSTQPDQYYGTWMAIVSLVIDVIYLSVGASLLFGRRH